MTSTRKPAAAKVPATVTPKPLKINAGAAAEIGRDPDADYVANPFTLPVPPKGVLPSGKTRGQAVIAMDWSSDVNAMFAWAMQGAFSEGIGFMGYPYLAQLTQRPEYRRISEIIALEMTRKWIKITAKGKDAKDGKIPKMEEALTKFGVQALFRRMAELDGFFGRGQLFVDDGNYDDPDELKMPLVVDKRKIEAGQLRGFRVIEPQWSYPGAFNSDNPLKPNFYCPQEWYVAGKTVHASRLLTFVSRQLPDILKPAYAFGGLSMSQMAKPYVDNWLRTRQSVSDLVHAFSTMVLSTDLSTLLQDAGAATQLIRRAQLFNQTRDNRGLMMVNKDTEELTNVSAPLGSLDSLQAQSQEQMASVAGVPLVVLLGITPSGLNASSDGEIRTFYAKIKADQEAFFRPHLTTVFNLLQLHVFGDIDPDLGFEFNPLWEVDDKDRVANLKAQADTDVVYINAGVIDAEEVRERLAGDDESPYHGLDLNKVVEPPVPPGMEGDPDEDPDGEGDDGPPKPPGAGDGPPVGDAWEEGKHSRRTDGKFGKGGPGATPATVPGGSGRHGAERSQGRKPMAQKPIPAAKFDAAAYASSHDDPHVTPTSVLKSFPPDTAQRISEAVNRAKLRGMTIDRHRVAGEGAIAEYTPERAELQRKILTEPWTDGKGRVHAAMLSPERIAAATPAEGEQPTFIMLGGRGGSGKSKLAGMVYDPDKFLVLDSDAIKERLPEYAGYNASEVHEESSDMLDRALTFARLKGLNVVLDATMKSSKGAIEKIKAFQEDGFKTEAHYMHLPRQEAAKRAVSRFLGDTGRLVPPEIVLSNKDNEAAFNEARTMVDRWSFHDNNVPQGSPPVKISEGENARHPA